MSTPGGGVLRCLLVQAGQHLCALPITQLRRIERALPVHPLPGAARGLLGLVEYAGEPLPLLDLAALVEAPPGASPVCPVTVVAWAGGGEVAREPVGLAVDGALAIADIALGGLVGRSQGVVRGEVAVGGQVVRLLDLTALGVTEAAVDAAAGGRSAAGTAELAG